MNHVRRQDSLKEHKLPEEDGANLETKLPKCFTYSAADFHKYLRRGGNNYVTESHRRVEPCSDIADETHGQVNHTQDSSLADRLISKILDVPEPKHHG